MFIQMEDIEEIKTWIVSEEEASERLDKLLAKRFPLYSRTYFQYLIDQELVLIDGKAAKKRAFLSPGSEIEVEFALTPEISLEPEAIPLTILYEDEWLIAVNKPAGLVVHPGAGNWTGTFVHGLLYHCRHLDKGSSLRPGIVHRLDKETSGVLLAAKSELAQQKLVSLFATREIHKEYLAICVGNPGPRVIEGKIGRHPIRRKEMTILKEGGKEACTRCIPLAHGPHLSIVRLLPETGRTHQLRVHLKSINTPILGDSLYGSAPSNKQYDAARQMLHAETLRFVHPFQEKLIELKAPLPHDMEKLIQVHFPYFNK